MIRRMLPADLERICLLEKQCFSDPWQKEHFQYELNGNPFSIPLVYEEQGNILGYAILWITFEEAQVCNIAAASISRRRGIGQALMAEMLQIARQRGCETFSLEVRAGNEAAILLYEKFGLIKMRRIHQYYSDGEDAIVMMRGI